MSRVRIHNFAISLEPQQEDRPATPTREVLWLQIHKDSSSPLDE
jgi:hypothetical protein